MSPVRHWLWMRTSTGSSCTGTDAVDFDADAAHAQGQVRLRIDHRGVGDQIEVAEARRQLDRQLAVDQPFALPAILDQVLDGAHLQAVLPAESRRSGKRAMRAVGVDDLADDGRFLQAGQAGQIDAALGVAGRTRTPPSRRRRPGTWPLPRTRSLGVVAVVDGDLDGAGAVEGGGAGGDAGAGVDVRRERRGVGIEVVAGHGSRCRRSQIAGDMARQTMPQALRIMKLIASGVTFSAGDHQIALVLAVFVIHEDDHPALAQLLQGFFDGAETVRCMVCIMDSSASCRS